jgi:hypothetical protein
MHVKMIIIIIIRKEFYIYSINSARIFASNTAIGSANNMYFYPPLYIRVYYKVDSYSCQLRSFLHEFCEKSRKSLTFHRVEGLF